MSISLCSAIAGVVIQGASGSVGDCAGDLEVVAAWVEPIQSVRGPSAMVAGKDTVLRVDIKSTYSFPVKATLAFSVNRDPVPGGALPATEIVVPAGCPENIPENIPANAKRFYFPDPAPGDDCFTALATKGLRHPLYQLEPRGPLEGGGSYYVTVNLKSPVTEDVSNNSGDSRLHYGGNILEPPGRPLPVKETTFPIVYTHVVNDALYLKNTKEERDDAVLWSDRHVLGMFPVSPQGYAGLTCPDPLDCEVPGAAGTCAPTACADADQLGGCFGECVDGQCLYCPAIVEDFNKARQLADSLFPSYRRIVFLYPYDWQGYHGFPLTQTVGGPPPGGFQVLSFPNLVGARPDAITGQFNGFNLPVVPHEFAHTFGFRNHRDGVQADGYWVNCQAVQPIGADCQVNKATNMLKTIVDGDPPDLWIDRVVYDTVLAKLKREPDPAILSIFGTRSRTGRYTIDHLAELPTGSPSLPEHEGPSDYNIHLVDASGNLIGSIPLTMEFGWADPPVESNAGIFGPKILYPPETARIQFLYKDQVMLEIDPLSRILRDAIKAIPERGFDKNPDQRRKGLLEKVDALEKQLAEGKRVEAREKLQNDIRDKIEKWIVEFEKPRPLEFTKDRLLGLIDRTLSRIDTQIEQAPPVPTPSP